MPSAPWEQKPGQEGPVDWDRDGIKVLLNLDGATAVLT